MDFDKKINSKGGLSLPAALRRQYGIAGGEKVNVRVNASGEIVLKRIVGSCVFCTSDEDLKLLNGKYICGKCRAAVSEM